MDEKFTFIDVNTISSCHIESAEHRCLTKSAVIPQAHELVLTTCYYSPNYRLLIALAIFAAGAESMIT